MRMLARKKAHNVWLFARDCSMQLEPIRFNCMRRWADSARTRACTHTVYPCTLPIDRIKLLFNFPTFTDSIDFVPFISAQLYHVKYAWLYHITVKIANFPILKRRCSFDANALQRIQQHNIESSEKIPFVQVAHVYDPCCSQSNRIGWQPTQFTLYEIEQNADPFQSAEYCAPRTGHQLIALAQPR